MSTRLAALGGEAVRTKAFPGWPVFGKEEEEAVVRVVRSGKWGRLDGTEVPRFEERFAAYQGAKYGLATVNGSIALKIALLAIGIQAGDEVIVPPYTFMATAGSVVEVNAVPIFADIDGETFNLDAGAVEAAITPRTKAIIPVHIGGLPADMDRIIAIARKHDLKVIEDAAQVHGAEYGGRRVGAIGDIGCFSFQASKNLTSGEGGAIVSDNEALAETARSIHNCGRKRAGAWYAHFTVSSNFRMTEFQGAILNCQLDRLEAQAQKRAMNGTYLAKELAKIPGIHPQAIAPAGGRHAYHLFPLRYDPQAFGAPREAFIRALSAEGVPASAGYTMPLYRQKLFLNKSFGPFTGYKQTRLDLDYGAVRCPVAERICMAEGVWLTQKMLLGKRSDMDDIVRAVRKVYDKREQLRELA